MAQTKRELDLRRHPELNAQGDGENDQLGEVVDEVQVGPSDRQAAGERTPAREKAGSPTEATLSVVPS